jgi:hypothetical protein
MTSHFVRAKLELLYGSLGECARRTIIMIWSDDVSSDVQVMLIEFFVVTAQWKKAQKHPSSLRSSHHSSRPSKYSCLRHSGLLRSTATSRTSNSNSSRNRAPSRPSHPLLSTPTTTHDTMLGLRTATRAPFALSVFRNTAARRWSSGIGAKGLEGPADNAFNRERAAVKQHAADTSGECA